MGFAGGLLGLKVKGWPVCVDLCPLTGGLEVFWVREGVGVAGSSGVVVFSGEVGMEICFRSLDEGGR